MSRDLKRALYDLVDSGLRVKDAALRLDIKYENAKSLARRYRKKNLLR